LTSTNHGPLFKALSPAEFLRLSMEERLAYLTHAFQKAKEEDAEITRSKTKDQTTGDAAQDVA